MDESIQNDYYTIKAKEIIESWIKGELEDQFKNIKPKENLFIRIIKPNKPQLVIDEFLFEPPELIPSDYSEFPQQNISSLKKRIKYCKNPMEKKLLQKELNILYKEHKQKK